MDPKPTFTNFNLWQILFPPKLPILPSPQLFLIKLYHLVCQY